MLIVELAQKDEYESVAIYETAPEDDLAIFDKATNIEIKKIGNFPCHQPGIIRPMYAVSIKQPA